MVLVHAGGWVRRARAQGDAEVSVVYNGAATSMTDECWSRCYLAVVIVSGYSVDAVRRSAAGLA
jgi:hypothetical protein